ncbi:MAG: hypothetical protein ACI9OH_001542 [Oleispira sp.]|jgi:hypothetical protein
MKKFNKIIATVVISGLTLVGASAAFAQTKRVSTNDALAVTSAAITLEQAISIAHKTVGGTLAKAEFSTDDGNSVWELEVIDIDMQTFDVEIDADTGKVLKHEADKPDHEEDEDEDEDEDEED